MQTPVCKTDEYGTRVWYLNGKLHREDGPAVIYANGDQWWYLNGKLHREDGPAIIRANGDQLWYKNDKLHREDGPAIIGVNGDQTWYFEGRKVTEEWIKRYQDLKKKYSLLGVPVRDKWVVRKIVMSWYDNPRFKCVQSRLKKECLETFKK